MVIFSLFDLLMSMFFYYIIKLIKFIQPKQFNNLILIFFLRKIFTLSEYIIFLC